jgi:cytochrome c553
MMKLIYNIVLVSVMGALSLSVQAGGNAGAGQTIANEKCQACHGPDGNSPTSLYPRLAGQHADYLARALTEYKSGARSNPILSGFAASLSAQDIKDVSAWFASQTGLTSPVEPHTVQSR